MPDRTRIKTPYPSIEKTASKLGLSERRVTELAKRLDRLFGKDAGGGIGRGKPRSVPRDRPEPAIARVRASRKP